MHPSTRIRIGAALALFSGASGALGAVEFFDLQLLDVPGIVTDDAFSTARAINAQGQIVGWFPAGSTSGATPLGFLATPRAGGYTVTRFPAAGAGFTWVQPNDLNDAGVIVGQGRTSATTVRYAFANSNPAVSVLGTPPTDSEATAINGSGQVVGWRTVSGRVEAFHLAAGTAQALFPSGSFVESRALGINDRGQIVGYVNQTASTGSRAFVYDWNSKAVTDLGSITVRDPSDTPPRWREAYDAVSINNAGQVAATQPGGGLSHAVLFRGANVIDLGVVGAFDESFAAGISDTGWVVGFLKDAEARLGNSGFLWASGQMYDLSALPLPSDWTGITAVYDAYSYVDPTNSLRQLGTVVGEGLYKGAPRAFAMQIALQVPEPQTYLILGVGLLAIGAVRLRRLAPH